VDDRADRARGPELAAVTFKVNDAGSGFCWAHAGYIGPNGPAHCRNRSAGDRFRSLVEAFQKGGRARGASSRSITRRAISGAASRPRSRRRFRRIRSSCRQPDVLTSAGSWASAIPSSAGQPARALPDDGEVGRSQGEDRVPPLPRELRPRARDARRDRQGLRDLRGLCRETGEGLLREAGPPAPVRGEVGRREARRDRRAGVHRPRRGAAAHERRRRDGAADVRRSVDALCHAPPRHQARAPDRRGALVWLPHVFNRTRRKRSWTPSTCTAGASTCISRSTTTRRR